MKFQNKNILITGASSGIGAAFALLAAADKCTIVLASRDITKLEKIAKKVENLGSKAIIIQTDVTDETQVKNLFLEAKTKVGTIDLVHNNAGLGHIGKIYELTTEQINQMIEVNFKGMITVSKYAAEVMTRQKSGHIIMTASLASFIALPQWSVYNATKWGILGFSECIREELVPFGIKVTTIHPGAVDTEFFSKEKADVKIDKVGSSVTPEIVAEKIYAASFTNKRRVLIPFSSKMYAWLFKFVRPIADYLVGKLAGDIEYHENIKEDEPEFDK